MTLHSDSILHLYQAALSDVVAFDISSRGKIELVGPEAGFFLHNLSTNDVKNLPVGAGCEAFLCTGKARVIAHMLVGHYQEKEGSVLRLDFVPGFNEAVYQHLNHHLISEQVELTDRTKDFALLRLAGPRAAVVLTSVVGRDLSALPPYHLEAVAWPGEAFGHVRQVPDLGIPAWDCWFAQDQGELLKSRLAEAGVPWGDPQTMELLRLEVGTPVYGQDIDADRFVVEVNRPGAISYTKGCYLGQEPIVMARDRGQVNRLLLGVVAEGEEPLTPGAKLFSGEVEVGLVTSSAWSPRLGKVIALAYLRRGHQEPGTKLLAHPPVVGRPVVVAKLPFV